MKQLYPTQHAWKNPTKYSLVKYCCKSQTFKPEDRINEILSISVVLGKYLGLNRCTF